MARERIKGFWERVTPLIRIKYPTIKAFCEDADLNLQTFYNDRARLYYPPMDNIRRMAEKLDVSLDYLVFGQIPPAGQHPPEASAPQCHSGYGSSVREENCFRPAAPAAAPSFPPLPYAAS